MSDQHNRKLKHPCFEHSDNGSFACRNDNASHRLINGKSLSKKKYHTLSHPKPSSRNSIPRRFSAFPEQYCPNSTPTVGAASPNDNVLSEAGLCPTTQVVSDAIRFGKDKDDCIEVVSKINLAHKKQKSKEAIQWKDICSSDQNVDLAFGVDLSIPSHQTDGNWHYISPKDADRHRSLMNKIDEQLTDAIGCNQEILLKLWNKKESTISRDMFLYQLFSVLYHRFIRITSIHHNAPFWRRVDAANFKKKAIPLLKHFCEYINPNQNEDVQMEILVVIESWFYNQQNALICDFLPAVMEIFHQLLMKSIIEPCVFSAWSKMDLHPKPTVLDRRLERCNSDPIAIRTTINESNRPITFHKKLVDELYKSGFYVVKNVSKNISPSKENSCEFFKGS